LISLDAAGHVWNRWVLSYNGSTQKSVLEKLFGGTEPWRIAVVIVIAGLLVGLSLFFYFYLDNRKRPLTIEVRLVKHFLKKAEGLGIKRRPEETIARFAKRIAAEKSELAKSALILSVLFESVTPFAKMNKGPQNKFLLTVHQRPFRVDKIQSHYQKSMF